MNESWYCEHIANGPWQFILLIVPLVGAYFYGQEKRKLGWILIGLWLPLQFSISYVNNIVVNCAPPDEAVTTAPEQQQ